MTANTAMGYPTDYKVPLNFIPGVNHLPPEGKSPARRRRGSSYTQQLLSPISNYIRKKKHSEPIHRNDKSERDEDHDDRNRCWSPDSDIAFVVGGESSDDDNEFDYKLHRDDGVPTSHTLEDDLEASEKSYNNNNNSNNSENNNKNNDRSTEGSDTMKKQLMKKLSVLSTHSLASSLPDLTSEEHDKRKPQKLNRKKSYSTDISPLTANGDVVLLDAVQDKLRRKLPKTFYMTASIGMRNPLCATGYIRRNTVHNRESCLVETAARTHKKNGSLGSIDLSGFRNSGSFKRRGSLLSKLRTPSPGLNSPKSTRSLERAGTPPTPDGCRYAGDASPGLFNRARSYAGRRSASSTDSGHFLYDSCSSVDSGVERC